MDSSKSIIFLLGPSGAGKSHVGQFAGARPGWDFLEIDMWPLDGIKQHKLRYEWDRYLKLKDPGPLVAELEKRIGNRKGEGIVLSFPSVVLRTAEEIEAVASSIRIRYLSGAPEHCFAAFLQREQASTRGLDESHWRATNSERQVSPGGPLLFDFLSDPRMRPYVIQAFNPDGTHRNQEALLKELLS